MYLFQIYDIPLHYSKCCKIKNVFRYIQVYSGLVTHFSTDAAIIINNYGYLVYINLLLKII
jgi:hypothetical protein